MKSDQNRDSAKIKQEIDKLLKKGFATFYGGSFFLIPYLLNLGIVNRIKSLEIIKESGIPVEKAILALINLCVIGKKRLNRVKNITDLGIAAFAGLAKMPDFSFFHKFLDGIDIANAEKFNIECAKKFNEMNLFDGEIINLDRHFMSYYGEKKIGKSKHPTKNTNMAGVFATFTHDQKTGDPIFVRTDYPIFSPGVKPEDVAIPIINTTKEILGNTAKTFVFDKWFSVGSLLDYIDKNMNLKYITLLKLFKNRIKEMKSIPVEQFKKMADGKKITFIHTKLRNYEGEVRLVVLWLKKNDEDIYYGYLTNDDECSEEKAVDTYAKRWRIENFMKEIDFLNVDKLPGIDLSKIAALLAIKTVGYCTVSCLRRDIGDDYIKMNIEGISEKFLNLQAFVQSKGETIHITCYRSPPEVVALFTDLNKKLERKGIDPRIPWLNNKILKFHFK